MATDVGNEYDISQRKAQIFEQLVQDVFPQMYPPQIDGHYVPSEGIHNRRVRWGVCGCVSRRIQWTHSGR